MAVKIGYGLHDTSHALSVVKRCTAEKQKQHGTFAVSAHNQ